MNQNGFWAEIQKETTTPRSSHFIPSNKWENREMIGKNGYLKHESKWFLRGKYKKKQQLLARLSSK